MWCTRWYLPLLLLPLPTAPPYFLILFLLSLTMHARPCFYCIILLTTLFVSSCYWQPFPMNSPLSEPWADNVTTFAQALNTSLPHIGRPLPSVMHVVDRCWCDFSASGFFEPFNLSHWERISVDQFRADLERRQEVEENPPAGREAAGQDSVDNAAVSGGEAGQLTHKPTQTNSKTPHTAAPTVPSPHPGIQGTIWSRLQNLRRKFQYHHNPPLPDSLSQPDVRLTVPHTAAQERLLPLRKEYDLRPYGFDVVIDFRWRR